MLSIYENMKCNTVCFFSNSFMFVLFAAICGLNIQPHTVLKDAFDHFFCLGRHNHSSPLLRMLLLGLPLIEVV